MRALEDEYSERWYFKCFECCNCIYVCLCLCQFHRMKGCLTEWLRWWTRNPLGHSRVASNPAAVVNETFCHFIIFFWRHFILYSKTFHLFKSSRWTLFKERMRCCKRNETLEIKPSLTYPNVLPFFQNHWTHKHVT